MAEKKNTHHIQVTLLRSVIGQSEATRLLVKGLGLRRIRHTVHLRDTLAVRGMVEKVQHLVDIKMAKGEAPLFVLRHKA